MSARSAWGVEVMRPLGESKAFWARRETVVASGIFERPQAARAERPLVPDCRIQMSVCTIGEKVSVPSLDAGCRLVH